MNIGSLCTGYGGLDLAVEAVTGARTAWVCENDPHAARVLAARFPHAYNLGDLTVVDWSHVGDCDILTAGYPCQPFSHAGKRKGTADERHLFPYIANAVRHLRPRFVVLENVAGHLGLGFDTVLGSLAEFGYDARWVSVRASDVGAPHRRERVFIVASDSRRGSFKGIASDGHGLPVATECGATPTDASRQRHGRGEDGEGVGRVDGEDAAGAQERQRAREIPVNRSVAAWGQYAPAIARWEHALGRPAPAPTEPTGRNGGPRLSPRFVEWMMGLPEGWVTGVDGVSTTQQLKILGNGVVPQQAAYALRALGVVS